MKNETKRERLNRRGGGARGITLEKPMTMKIMTGLYGAVAAALVMSSVPAFATEGGKTEYPFGVDTIDMALEPAPGETQFYDYFQFYTASKFAGGSGQSMWTGFKANLVVNSFRIDHTFAAWGPLTWGISAIQPVGQIGLTSQGTAPDGPKPVGHGANFNNGGLFDSDFRPLQLSYAVAPNMFIEYSQQIWLPDGNYNPANPASPGLNHWSFGEQVLFTWYLTKAWEFDGSGMFSEYLKNPTDGYQSGNDFTFDYMLGYRPIPSLPKLQFGLVGYFYKQYQPDRVNGAEVTSSNINIPVLPGAVGNGFEGQAIAVGLQVRYDLFEHGGIVAKWDHEMDVRNRPEGDRFWAQFSHPF